MADENLVPNDDNRLEDVSAGKDSEKKPERGELLCCPRCGSTNVYVDMYTYIEYVCADCGCRGF